MAAFDRFDIVEAHYIWLILHHVGIVAGRADPEWWCSYNRLSTIDARLRFRPAANLSLETLTENGREIYDGLCQRAGWCGCRSGGSGAGNSVEFGAIR